MNLTIRPSQIKDVPLLKKLYNSDTFLFGEDRTGYDLEDIEEYICDPKKKMFVAECNDVIIGALLAEYHTTYAILDTIIVDKEYQGKGVGKILMDHFENDVRSANIPLIESLTEVNNKRMQHIFESREYNSGNTFIFYSKKL